MCGLDLFPLEERSAYSFLQIPKSNPLMAAIFGGSSSRPGRSNTVDHDHDEFDPNDYDDFEAIDYDDDDRDDFDVLDDDDYN